MIFPSIQQSLEGSAYFQIFFGGTDFVIASSKYLVLLPGSKLWLRAALQVQVTWDLRFYDYNSKVDF